VRAEAPLQREKHGRERQRARHDAPDTPCRTRAIRARDSEEPPGQEEILRADGEREGADRPARPEEGACRRDDRERGGALGELKQPVSALALAERADLADETREESHKQRRREDLDVDARLVPLPAEYGAQLPADGQAAADRHDAERRADRER